MAVALLDGDIIAYRAACSGQEEDPFGQPGDMDYDPKKATDTASAIIRSWIKGAKAERAIVAFSGPDCFRYHIYPKYKHTRKGEKPALYAQVVSFIERSWKCIRKDHLEADDTIGILASKDPSKYVAVSIDKDFDTIPGRIFNPDKDALPRTIRPQMADRSWLMQALTGDTVDGYPGCPKVGPVNAKRILDGAGMKLPAMWAAVVEAFESKGLTEDDALVQARVARILRHTDFDFDTREIILWHPRRPQRLEPSALMGAAGASQRGAATSAASTQTPPDVSPAENPTDTSGTSTVPSPKTRSPRKRTRKAKT